MLRPFSWYKRFVIEGARQHRLPEDYVATIAAAAEVEDSDQARDAVNRRIMC